MILWILFYILIAILLSPILAFVLWTIFFRVRMQIRHYLGHFDISGYDLTGKVYCITGPLTGYCNNNKKSINYFIIIFQALEELRQ